MVLLQAQEAVNCSEINAGFVKAEGRLLEKTEMSCLPADTRAKP